MFAPYVNLLPAVHQGIPLFFGPAAVAAMQYPPASEQLKRRSRFLVNFARGPLAAASGASHGGPFDGRTVDANALGWAYACASSRAFRIAGPEYPAAMLPLIDVANHSFDPTAMVRPAPGGAIEMAATKSLKTGDEVSLNYGNLTNDAFLLDYGFVPLESAGANGGNPYDAAGLRWDVGLLEAAREIAGLSAVPFGASAAGMGTALGGDAPFAPWQKQALMALGLESGGAEAGAGAAVFNPEVLVTRHSRQPVDMRLLAGLRVLYASSPGDLMDGAGKARRAEGSGRAGDKRGGVSAEMSEAAGIDVFAPLTLGSLWDSPLDRVREVYALRTCQAALALALGNFPTTMKEDEEVLRKLAAESAAADGDTEAASRADIATAVRFRMGKKSVISGAMKIIDERLRAVIASGGGD